MADISAAEFDLARNFGFDITMPEGNMGIPGAVHKEYLDKCHALYREFLSNMSIHIKNEKTDKEFLNKLLREKMQNLKYSLYRSENMSTTKDPFAKQSEAKCESLDLSESRDNSPGALDVIPDEVEQNIRPHTAPPGVTKKPQNDEARPKTAAVVKRTSHDTDNLSDISLASRRTVAGKIDQKTERSSNRKITVGHHSFAKLARGNLKAKMQNRDGRFLMKPMKTDYKSDQSRMMAYDPDKAPRTFDPVNEKIALVRQITSYRSPTISSDMKINNRLPIQKNLQGLEAKRTTVLGIYQNARDRQSRHFRIVTDKHKASNVQSLLQKQNSENADLSMLKSISIQLNDTETYTETWSRQNDRTEMNENNSNPSKMIVIPTARGKINRRSPSPVDDMDLAASASQLHLKNITNESENRPEDLDETHRSSPTKVAFVKSESRASLRNRTTSQTDNSDRGHSRSSFRDRTASQTHSDRGTARSPASPNVQAKTYASTLSVTTNQKHGAESSDASSMRKNRRMSVLSVATAASFVHKLKAAAAKPSADVESNISKLSFSAPSKFQSSQDTIKIVKQQMRQDRELDERMTVWRRRMSVRSSVSGVKGVLRAGRLSRGKLQLI